MMQIPSKSKIFPKNDLKSKIDKVKILKRIIKFIGIGLLLLILGIGVYIYNSGPILPEDAGNIISEVISKPLPEMINGETGFANSKGIKIWYESIAPKQESKGVVVLIMGISNDAMGWPLKFIEAFTDVGYQVVRYDHRGTGLSDWPKDFENNPYSLSDMAFDAVSILDTLQIEKANIVGISMGGMIAQQLAIDHPQRVQSLTSIMSSGNIFDPSVSPISSKVAYDLIKTAIKYSVIKSEKNMIKLHIASRIILRGDASYQLNIKELSEQVLYNIRKRNGYNSDVSRQHQAAVANSSSRYEALKNLNIRTLIIHGMNDPFIPIEHSRKCARLIPNADSLWVDNMGHDIPNEYIPVISQKIMDILTQE